MSRRVRFAAGFGVVIVVLALVVLALVSLSDDDGYVLEAEFENVRGLLEDNDVAMNGAKVGSVESIELTERSTARVKIHLDEDAPRPRADAAATVRPVDLLGDIYLSYSPGQSDKPLRGRIPTSRTGNVSRLADILRAFQPKAREGLQAMLVDLSIGLERRGVDLNRAAVELRPAIEATDEVMAELSSQNASLRHLIDDSQRVTGQLAERDEDLDGLVRAFARTVRTTAGHDPALERGLERLAPTFAQLRDTTAGLATTATAAQPLASELADSAPGLTTAMHRLRPFLRELDDASRVSRPTLRRTTALLRDGSDTFAKLTGGLRALHEASPEVDSVTTTAVPLVPLISEALFVKVADQTEEPGNQPLDPTTDPLRHYWRGAAALSCESFGLKISPGCLDDFLASTAGAATSRERESSAAPQEPRQLGAAGALAKPANHPGESRPTHPRAPGSNPLLDFLLGP